MEIAAIIILGITSGTLVNYLSDVLPVYRRFCPPECMSCHNRMGWGRFVALLACSNCGAIRSKRSYIIVLGFPLILFLVWLHPPVRIGFWFGWLILLYFSLVGIIDLEHRAILHQVSAFGLAIGVSAGIISHGLSITLLGGFAGAGLMLLLYYFGIVFIRILSRIRHQQIDEIALGFGDVILGGILGLLVGWPEITGALMLAILIAGLVSALLILTNLALRRYKPLLAIPYAPFLLLGAAIFIYIPK